METFSALLAFCAGNRPVTDEFPAQRPMTRSFDVLFDLRLNKRLSKQSWTCWLETPSRSLWRHCNRGTLCDQNIRDTDFLVPPSRSFAVFIRKCVSVIRSYVVIHKLCEDTPDLLTYPGSDVSNIARDHSVYVASQWETVLHSNAVYHWLGAYTEWCMHHQTSPTENIGFYFYSNLCLSC